MAGVVGGVGLAYEAVRGVAPGRRRDLRNYLKVYLGLDVPDVRVCEGHCSPMDYVWHAWSVDFLRRSGGVLNGDAVVWANRGGGKTRLAAAATLLDCVFKPGCSVRILGGSLEQSSRMYEYLLEFVRGGFGHLLAGSALKGQCRFANGSSVEVLAQSARSVRGRHVRKLRCDEVESFDEGVYNAAKFITSSGGGIAAAMESASTSHRPYGLMQKVVEQAESTGAPVFKWCLFEVIERCRDRNCSGCVLWGDCRGRAKTARGYLRIEDAITQMRRSSRSGWESEMLCVRRGVDNAVFADFSEAVHVRAVDYDASLPLYRAIDFGFVNPFVCLWVQVDEAGDVRVIDEYVRRRATIEAHAAAVRDRTPCEEEAVAATYCDPAGGGRNVVTGTSAVRELAEHGIRARYAASHVLDGIELIRRAIRRGDGTSHLVVSRRCVRLIEALRGYHYGDRGGACELPEKDGVYDHPVDALRYFFVNFERERGESRRY